MNGYRSCLAGSGNADNAASYTMTLTRNGVTSLAPGSCYGMFANNATMNSKVVIGRAVNRADYMLLNCTNFNQDIDVHGGVNSCAGMLEGCTKFARNVYFHGRNSAINAQRLLANTSNFLRKNVWFQSSMNTYFNNTDSSSLVGQPVTWTTITNGFYNAAFNVYCFYNYAQ